MIYKSRTTLSISDLQRCYEEVNSDLPPIFNWAGVNGLKLNPKESQVILIHHSRAQIPQPELYIGSDAIRVVNSVNNLGFVLNENLTAVDHSKRVCRRIYSILRSIRPHTSHTPFPVRKRLVQFLVAPHINYGNIVYSSVDVASRSRIRVAFNACLRYIHRVRPRDHICHLENSVSGMSLGTSAGAQLLTFVYKILHVRHPSYIFSLFHFASSARTRNLVVPLHRSHAMSQLFIVRSVVL
jgi:hypothetical protein